MTRPFPAPGIEMRHAARPPKDCAVCGKPIEKPTFNQKVHAGKCHREWNRRNMAKFHARKKAAKARKKERARVGAVKAIKPARSRAYLDFIRSLPCIACHAAQVRAMVLEQKAQQTAMWSHYGPVIIPMPRQESPTEAAHTGAHALASKSSDLNAIPLCGIEHHREGRWSYHKLGRGFFKAHGLSLPKIIRELHARYEAERRAAA